MGEVWIKNGTEKEFKEEMLRKYPKEWYQCARCGNIYKKGVSDEEAAKEYKKNFPNDSNMEWDRDLICDDCYKEFKPWLNKKTPKERKEIEEEYELEIKYGEELEKLTKKFAERWACRLCADLGPFTEYSDFDL